MLIKVLLNILQVFNMATEAQKRASKNYYHRNKEEKKAKAKLRYKTDPEYRKRRKEINKKYQRKLSAEKKRIKAEQRKNKLIWKTFTISGKPTLCCRLGHLAKSIGRESITIRLWIREGKFPETFKYNKQRYFTQNHYNLVIKLWNEYGYCTKFFNEITNQWNKAYE